MRDFNRDLDTGHAKIRTFSGVISKQFPYYVAPTLENGNFDKAISHFGVNNLLQNRNRLKAVDELILNLEKTATKSQDTVNGYTFGVSKAIVSGIVFNKRVANSFVDEVNSKVINIYKHNSFGYINNRNISNIYLFDDGLHLLESGICILANNFICRLNYFCRRIYTIQTHIFN